MQISAICVLVLQFFGRTSDTLITAVFWSSISSFNLFLLFNNESALKYMQLNELCTLFRGRSGILDRLLNWTTLLKSNFTIRAHHGTIYLITLHLKSSRQREDGEQGACFEDVSNKCFLLPLI